MATLNLYQCIGRLGKDPELTITANGNPCVKFTLAVDKVGKDREGNRTKETLWLNMVAWNKIAELIEKYTQKGSEIYVQGRLEIRGYTDKEGTKRQAVEILVDQVQLLGGKQASAAATAPSPSTMRPSDDFDPFLDDTDELP